MLSYFKINDPFRLVPILFLAFLLKLPTLLHPVQYFETAHWFVIGEAMQHGSMYSDIWDGMAPFSAVVFQAITWMFGRSILTLYILGIVLTFVQSIILNNLSIRAKVFENNTYLPALIYVLFTSSHPAFFTLSPTLVGLTLILLGLGNLLSHVEFRAKKDIQIIMIGLYFGMGSLFYFPFIVFLPISLILLLAFTNTLSRRYFLLLYGSVFPLVAAFFYYWLKSDHPGYFIHNFINIYNIGETRSSIGWQMGLFALGTPLLLFLLGLISFGKQRRITNYQSRIVQLFLLSGALMMGMMFLEAPITFFSLAAYLPIITFFTVHFVTLFRRRLITLMLSFVLFGGPFISLWAQTYQWFPKLTTEANNTDREIDKYREIVKGKSMMVLGQGKELYTNARLAGPFYDWGLSEDFFKELNYYDNLVFLQDQFNKSTPEVIIDLENLYPQIERQLPLVTKNYYQLQPNVWLRKQ